MGQGRAIAICGSSALMDAETPRQLSAVRRSQWRGSGKTVMSFEAVCEEASEQLCCLTSHQPNPISQSKGDSTLIRI
jgi:hypothetical protein